MIKKFLGFLIVPVLIAMLGPWRQASAQDVIEPDSGSILCVPGIYLIDPEDCIPLGPSQTLTKRAKANAAKISFNTAQPPTSLTDLPYNYFQVDAGNGTYLYTDLTSAMERSGGFPLKGDSIIVSYIDHVQNDRGHYFHLKTGEWIPGDGSRIYPQYAYQFQGLLFKSTPRVPFGWALFDAEVHSQPSLNDPVVRMLARYEIVHALEFETREGFEWVRISENEWVLGIRIGLVFPETTPPQGITGDRWIDVNLAEQTIAVYEHRRLIFASLVATGLDPFWTRPGLFQIYEKKETEDMSGAFTADKSDYYLLQDVPWTMYFDKARALHGAYWRAGFGYPQSHGCVNLSIGDANWLYQWAQVGDWVYVHDPSGVTPTDPAFYGDGGA